MTFSSSVSSIANDASKSVTVVTKRTINVPKTQQSKSEQQIANTAHSQVILPIPSSLDRFLSFFIPSVRYRLRVPELFLQHPNPPAHSPVIIIGSGFGGSISALRLSESESPVVPFVTVLERGQRWPHAPHRPNIHPLEHLRDGRGLWHRHTIRTPYACVSCGKNVPIDYFGGILDVTEFRDAPMEILRTSCVGGGSKTFSGVMIEPAKREYFDEIFEGTSIHYEEMRDVYYKRVREKLKLSPVPDDIYNSPPFAKSKVWDEQAMNAGYKVKRPDSIYNWDVIRGELNGDIPRAATIGQSNFGESNGAKFDLTQNYLREAEASGKVHVYPNQQVVDIEMLIDEHTRHKTFAVHVNRLTPFGEIAESYTLTCDKLICSAGAVGTSQLLVRARSKNLIPDLPAAVGLGFGTNGNAYLTRCMNPIRGSRQATPCTSLIHDDCNASDGKVVPTTVEAWYVPGMPFEIGVQSGLGLCYLKDRIKNRGKFYYDKENDTVELEWPKAINIVTENACRNINNRMANSKPYSKPGVPWVATDVFADFTAHPLGGAVLGVVTDDVGRVKNVPGLYVIDGALLPGTAGAANPSLTISALSERCIDHIIAEDF